MSAFQPYNGAAILSAALVDSDYRRSVTYRSGASEIGVGDLNVNRNTVGGVFAPALVEIPADKGRFSVGVAGNRFGLAVSPPASRLTASPTSLATSWGFNAASTQANAVPSIIPGDMADLLLDTSANDSHFATQAVTVGTLAGRTAHAIIKPNGRTRGALWMQVASTFARIDFDLATGGFIVSAGIGGLIPLQDGWFMVWTAGENATTGSMLPILAITNDAGASTYVGDGSGFAVADFEMQTASPGPPMPIISSTTRDADEASFPVSGIPSSGTLFVDASVDGRGADQSLIAMRTVDASSYVRITHLNDPVLGAVVAATVIKAGLTVASAFAYGSALPCRVRAAVSWNANGIVLAVQGLATQTETGNCLLTSMAQIDVGHLGGAATLNGSVGRWSLLPWRDAASLEELVG